MTLDKSCDLTTATFSKVSRSLPVLSDLAFRPSAAFMNELNQSVACFQTTFKRSGFFSFLEILAGGRGPRSSQGLSPAVLTLVRSITRKAATATFYCSVVKIARGQDSSHGQGQKNSGSCGGTEGGGAGDRTGTGDGRDFSWDGN